MDPLTAGFALRTTIARPADLALLSTAFPSSVCLFAGMCAWIDANGTVRAMRFSGSHTMVFEPNRHNLYRATFRVSGIKWHLFFARADCWVLGDLVEVRQSRRQRRRAH